MLRCQVIAVANVPSFEKQHIPGTNLPHLVRPVVILTVFEGGCPIPGLMMPLLLSCYWPSAFLPHTTSSLLPSDPSAHCALPLPTKHRRKEMAGLG
jgi:hypothetical protein